MTASASTACLLDVMQVRAFADAALTRNLRSQPPGASDSLPIGNDLFDAVAWLPDSDAAARAAFDLLSGEIHASGKTVAHRGYVVSCAMPSMTG